MVHRGRRAGLATGAALAAVIVAGCGEETSSPEPQIGGDPSASTSAATGSPAPSGQASEAFDDEGYETHRGRVKADGAEEAAVAEAWFAYWEVLGEAYYRAEVDAAALGRVAQGESLTEVVDYVDYLQKDGLHTEGDARIGVSRIEVNGDAALIRGCMENKSVDVDDSGQPAEELTPYVDLIGTLAKVDGTWLVETKDTSGVRKCKA